MPFTKEQRNTAYQKLSETEKEFVSSNENIEIIETIGKKYQLNAELSDMLDTEVYNTLIGLQSIDELIVTLEKSLGIAEGRVIELVGELKKQIFVKLDDIRKTLPQTSFAVPAASPAGTAVPKTITPITIEQPAAKPPINLISKAPTPQNQTPAKLEKKWWIEESENVKSEALNTKSVSPEPKSPNATLSAPRSTASDSVVPYREELPSGQKTNNEFRMTNNKDTEAPILPQEASSSRNIIDVQTGANFVPHNLPTDNSTPPVPPSQNFASPGVVSPTKPPLNILHEQSGTSPLEQKLNQSTTGTENTVVKKTYPPGLDPYREPTS
jgi:hypothetical protein